MMMKFKIAFRNVIRNRRRTLVNVLMIGAGISAMVVFEGFASHMVRALEHVAVNNQYGHLQIADRKTWSPSAKDKPRDRLLNFSEKLRGEIKALPGVAYSSGRISFFGLLNNGEQSVSARGVAIDPEIEKKVISNTPILKGQSLRENGKFEIIAGKGIAEQMGMRIGQSFTVMAQTFDGSVNAIDCELVGVFNSGLAELDDSTFFIPLKTAQRLLDTDLVERIMVQLQDEASLTSVAAEIQRLLPKPLEVKIWKTLAVYYRQVVDYFGMQNLVIQWILMLLAFLAVGNVVGTTIAERTGEIGTVRALGASRSALVEQFVIEGVLLGLIGGVIGAMLGYFSAIGINLAHIPIMTPGSSKPMDLEVDLLPAVFVKGFIAMGLMALFATLMPATKASKVEIVDALKRNI